MGSIGVAAVLSGRRRASFSFLAVAVLVLLVMNPWLAANYSFVLSVLATLSLVLLGTACSRWLQRFLPVPLAHAVAMPMAAQVFCAPVIVQLQPELALYSIPANAGGRAGGSLHHDCRNGRDRPGRDCYRPSVSWCCTRPGG